MSRFTFRGKYWIVDPDAASRRCSRWSCWWHPIFKMLSPLGLTNSLTGLVIVYTAFNVPFAVVPDAVLLRRAFRRDLEEAAHDRRRDAASWPFARSFVPLTLPGMAATLGFVFTAAWSELLFALMLISKHRCQRRFPVGLLSFVSKFGGRTSGR